MIPKHTFRAPDPYSHVEFYCLWPETYEEAVALWGEVEAKKALTEGAMPDLLRQILVIARGGADAVYIQHLLDERRLYPFSDRDPTPEEECAFTLSEMTVAQRDKVAELLVDMLQKKAQAEREKRLEVQRAQMRTTTPPIDHDVHIGMLGNGGPDYVPPFEEFNKPGAQDTDAPPPGSPIDDLL